MEIGLSGHPGPHAVLHVGKEQKQGKEVATHHLPRTVEMNVKEAIRRKKDVETDLVQVRTRF